jgi:hypothetical protein
LANINDFWELVKVAGGGTSSDLTKVLDSIVRSDRGKVDTFFENVIDQLAFNTDDWRRLREFYIDIYSAHRAISTQSSQISDVSNLSNDELDELFRSFGYPESPILRDYDNNPLPTKIALFLSLVDLYKIKGTPRSILEALQFYGITKLDIFEFWLQKEDRNSIFFRGDVITGTSLNPDSINLSFDLLTQGDPHWLLTEQQILQLDRTNDINLPSKSPYFAVVPIVEFGSETPMFIRTVHDQYESYKNTGNLPPQNAELRILGEVVSFLELYLSCVYEFQKLWTVGYKGDRFLCYDGDATSSIIINSEYDSIIEPPITRDNIPVKLLQYYDQFTRETPRHFLQNKSDAETILNQINPTLKTELDNLTDSDEEILQSLLKDLGVWVRNNIGFGFVNAGYITFGLKNLFDDLKGVINFFKPYRARLVLLEKLLFNTRLTNAIRLDDEFVPGDINLELHDFLTGDSKPCCSALPIDATEDICFEVGETLPACTRVYSDTTGSVFATGLWQDNYAYTKGDSVITGGDGTNDYRCKKSHTSSSTTKPTTGSQWTQFWEVSSTLQCIDTTGNTFYNRNTYDCGSYFDIGAVTDIAHDTHHTGTGVPTDVHLNIEQGVYDRLRCYHCVDSTGCEDLGCSDCINDGYCRFLGYDCLRTPIDTDGYIYSDVIADSTTGIVSAEIRPGVYTTDFDECYDAVNTPFDSTSCQAYDSTNFTYFQTGGFADFDKGGMFDCTHGFDLVQITIEENVFESYILKEDGGKLLLEDGGGILLEEGNVSL